MVWSVWEDGEITLEKGGSLFGLRNLHSIFAAGSRKLDLDLFPIRERLHSRLFVNDESHAQEVAAFIQEHGQ